MNRRKFIEKGALTGSFFAFGGASAFAGVELSKDPDPTFNLNYAPHLGMFEASAGKDEVAQLEFMADKGFRSFEDNEMKGRSLETQKRMAAAMERLGLDMGVFVEKTSCGTSVHFWRKELGN